MKRCDDTKCEPQYIIEHPCEDNDYKTVHKITCQRPGCSYVISREHRHPYTHEQLLERHDELMEHKRERRKVG